MQKAVIYVRVSSEEQAKHGFSIENQKKACKEFACKEGYFVDEFFIDEGKSAKNLEREEVQKLMAYCSNKKNDISVVIIWRLDRLSRNNEDYHGVLRPLFASKGIKLLSATEANVDTIEGELMRNIGMNFAEYERKIIGVRTIAGLRQKAEQGCFPGRAPMGYKNISKEDGSKTIIIDERYAFYIRRAFELYDSGLYSIRSLASKLYDDGLRNKSGSKVAKSNIEFILKNIFYTGVFIFENKTYENANHKAIISKELFYRVQNKLIDPNKTRKKRIDFAYTGIIRCGHCDCLLTAELKKNKYIYYHCTGNKGGSCKKDYIREEKIDKAIAEILKLIIIPTETREKIAIALKKVHAIKNNYSNDVKTSIQKQIEILEKRIEKAFQEKLDENITHDFWKINNDKWHTEKNKLYIKLQEINKFDKTFYEQSNVLLKFIDDAYDLYLQGSLEQRKRIINIISQNLSYKDKEFSIELKPVFQTIVQNAYNLRIKNANNRTLESGYSSGLDTDLDPENEKYSPGWTRTNNPPVNSRMLCH